jgi:hypothetical protein
VVFFLIPGKVGKEILDVTAKVLGTAAAATALYNNWIKNPDAGGSNDNSNKDKSKENKNSVNNENVKNTIPNHFSKNKSNN